jgi:hypothetical protein
MRRVVVGLSIAVLILGAAGAAKAESVITQDKMDAFFEAYPVYVKTAQTMSMLPSSEELASLGEKMEGEDFDPASLVNQNADVDAFRAKMTETLAAYNMSIEEFSELAAKISIIYSNMTIKEAMKDSGEEDLGGISEYTDQFQQTLSSMGISYSDAEAAVVEQNFDKLNGMFTEVLMQAQPVAE